MNPDSLKDPENANIRKKCKYLENKCNTIFQGNIVKWDLVL
jgi:hypothetical protein